MLSRLPRSPLAVNRRIGGLEKSILKLLASEYVNRRIGGLEKSRKLYKKQNSS